MPSHVCGWCTNLTYQCPFKDHGGRVERVTGLIAKHGRFPTRDAKAEGQSCSDYSKDKGGNLGLSRENTRVPVGAARTVHTIASEIDTRRAARQKNKTASHDKVGHSQVNAGKASHDYKTCRSGQRQRQGRKIVGRFNTIPKLPGHADKDEMRTKIKECRQGAKRDE